MRRLLCAAVVLSACAPSEKSGAPGGPARKYAGTWDGRSYRSASDTGIPFRIVTAVAQDGSLRGTMTYTSLTAPPRAGAGAGSQRHGRGQRARTLPQPLR